MAVQRNLAVSLAFAGLTALAACGASTDPEDYWVRDDPVGGAPGESTFSDLFLNIDDPNITLEVNKYIWNASLDVLNFLPIQSADPFSGVIVTGFGTPPGGGRSYRATIYVQDPALDARSLNVALHTQSGPASPDAVRAVEDAILTRARQLRLRDADL
ncbi:DUF3576 domain-containing protein [Pseudoruegeria sp. SHC-113]|uniref:DUF3576 domain-containing protein n=1 Tax=Pseudoruegeria sp. SHC-113 TaxID=2855439 RepID=UPI0021BB14E9|nr:DUF3576 domain-containing protein [Pseudoruegeria sp. SHC-113]MCT8158476.1 DUF3576 domain-containing protein [Pseudoruegeria sp. SHC-113]